METFYIPTEDDFKKWIKEAINESIENFILKNNVPGAAKEEEFLSRKDIAKKLRVSLVTLTDWVKRGLPSHKQRGRVYFLQSEVMDYIKKNKLRHYLNNS